MSPTDCSHEGGQNFSWNSLDLSVVIQCTGNIFLHIAILTAYLDWIFWQQSFALKRKSEYSLRFSFSSRFLGTDINHIL